MLRLQRITSTLLTALIGVSLFFLCKVIFYTPKNSIHAFIPGSSQFVCLVNTNTLMRTSIESALLNEQDKELLSLLQKQLDQTQSSDSKPKDPGIDIMGDIAFVNFGKGTRALLVDLKDAELFTSFCKENQLAFDHNTAIGVIFLKNSLKKGLFFKQNYRKIPSDGTPSRGTIAHLFVNSKLGKGTITLGIEGQTVRFKGVIENQHKITGTLLESSNRNGITISSAIVSDSMQEAWKGLLQQIGIRPFEINSFSLNYNGTKLVSHNEGTYVVPKIELIVETKRPTSIRNIMSAKKIRETLGYKLVGDSLVFGSDRLYMHQLSSNQFYLGEKKSFQPKAADKELLIHFGGELNSLLKIEGNDMINAFLSIIPLYTAGKNFTNHTKVINVSAKQKGKKVIINGQLEFKKGHLPTNEFLKFVLSGQFFE